MVTQAEAEEQNVASAERGDGVVVRLLAGLGRAGFLGFTTYHCFGVLES